MRSRMFYKPNLAIRILRIIGIILGVLLVTFVVMYTVSMSKNIEKKVAVNDKPQVETLDFELDPGISYNTITSDTTLFFYSSVNMKIINKNGKQLEDVSLKLTNPTTSANGSYVLFYDAGGRDVLVYKNSKNTLSLMLDENIILAKINKNGYILFITESDLHNCSARVYSPKGEEIFVWNSGALSVVGADIADNNKDITVSAINTDAGTLKNQIMMFNIAKEKPYTNDTYESDVFSVISYRNGYLYCVGTETALIYNSYGKCTGNIPYEGHELKRYAIGEDFLLLAFSGTNDSSGVARLASYNRKGKLLGAHSVGQDFDFLDTKNGKIVLNNGRTITVLNSHCIEKKYVNLNFDLRDFVFFNSQNKGVGITASGAVFININ